MKEYKSDVYKHLHGEFKDMLKDGDITAERMAEFERECFKDAADSPQGRAVHTPAMATASPGAQGRSIK
jgi:putative transcriptional regulator